MISCRACRMAPVIVWLVTAFAVPAADRPPSPPLPAQSGVEDALDARGDILVVLGAEGEAAFGAQFSAWATIWEEAARQGRWRFHLIGDLVGDSSGSQARDQLQTRLSALAQESALPLWIVCIGHGTFDGRSARFNLLGEDFSADELAAWLAGMQRPAAVLQCASASAPFLSALSAPNRVVISATKSGQEVNFARFGGALAAAAVDPTADLDKDRQVSLLEAFLRAARRTEEFYAGENRLATEHPLLDDNGDGRGTRAAAFAGVRPVREADSGVTLDGYAAHQWFLIPSAAEAELPPERRARRDALEREIFLLRDRKADFTAEAYYAELERLLVQLARVSLGRDQ